MAFKCELCNRDFNLKESLDQHINSKHKHEEKKSSVSFRKYFLIGIFGLIVVFIVLAVYIYAGRPGQYDDFARCLNEKGVVIYGNDFCQYTNKQLNFFGKSWKYLNYVKCIDNKELCDSKGISVTPTWEINGKMYGQVQTFEALAAVSGCSLN